MFRKIAIAAVVAAGSIAAWTAGAAAAEKIVISHWDAYWPPDLLANFTKETGIEAEWAVHINNEDMMGKVTASGGKGYDVVFASTPLSRRSPIWASSPISITPRSPTSPISFPEAQDLPYDPGNKHSVPYTWGTTGLCYRSDLLKRRRRRAGTIC